MTKSEIRIKCIEFCNRLDFKAEDIIAKAEILEKWITEQEAETQVEKTPVKRGRQGKVDTASILD